MRALVLFLGALVVWTVLVILWNDAYGLTVSDDPEDGGANMAARVGFAVVAVVWVIGATVIAATALFQPSVLLSTCSPNTTVSAVVV